MKSLFNPITIMFMSALLSLSFLVSAQPDQDEAILLQHHRNILKALVDNDVERLFSAVAPTALSLEEGLLEWKSRDDAIKKRIEMMKTSRYFLCEDMVPPVVRVANDGSLGWLAASVKMIGQRTKSDASIEKISMLAAWVELYEKRQGNWVFVGSSAASIQTVP